MQMYHLKQKSPTAFSSTSLLGFKMQSTRFAQQWLFPLEISKQVTQTFSPHQDAGGPECPCPGPPRLCPAPSPCPCPRTLFEPPGAISPCPSDAAAEPVYSSQQPHPVPAMGPTKLGPPMGLCSNLALVHPRGDA